MTGWVSDQENYKDYKKNPKYRYQLMFSQWFLYICSFLFKYFKLIWMKGPRSKLICQHLCDHSANSPLIKKTLWDAYIVAAS